MRAGCAASSHRGIRARPAPRGVRAAAGGIPSLVVSPNDRYGSDVLSGDWRAPRRGRSTPTPAEPDLVVEEVETGWVGAVVRVEKAGGMHVVHLEDRRGRTKAFPLGPGFLVDGAPVTLTPPQAAAATALADARRAASRTASGSVAVEGARARVASGSRIYVEGRHDAELVEKVWGDDLRVEGVVVELMDGVDDLAGIIAEFEPGPGRRLGVLVDHLVPGTKEARIVEQARALPGLARHVKILGHPYVDVWQSVRPERLAGSSGRSSRGAPRGSTASAPSSGGRTRARPTSHARGSASSGRCAPTRTSSRPSSRASRSSSTS